MCYIRYEKGNTSERLPVVYRLLIKITANFVRVLGGYFYVHFLLFRKAAKPTKKIPICIKSDRVMYIKPFPFVYFPCKISFPGVLGTIFQRAGSRPPLWYCQILLYHILHSMTILPIWKDVHLISLIAFFLI